MKAPDKLTLTGRTFSGIGLPHVEAGEEGVEYIRKDAVLSWAHKNLWAFPDALALLENSVKSM